MTDINFINIDAGEIYDELISTLETEVKEPLYPGDERRIFGEALNIALVTSYNKMNDRAKQRFLRFARDYVLDAIGEDARCPRLEKTKSGATLKFKISDVRPQNIIIPKDTRVTADSKLYFQTKENAIIPAGQLDVLVKSEAIEGGTEYNGFSVGQINLVVDKWPFVLTVENTEETKGGTDGEPYSWEAPYTEEGNDSYRERIRLSPAAYSTAGPEDAYIYHAKSAHPDVGDVYASSEQEAGTITVVIVNQAGQKPGEAVIDAVKAKLNQKQIAPLTDKIIVIAAEYAEYDIELVYYTTSSEKDATITEVEGTGGAIERYIDWQKSAIGRAINPDRLKAEILKSNIKPVGADHVDITKPEYAAVDKFSIAKFSGKMNVKFEVTE